MYVVVRLIKRGLNIILRRELSELEARASIGPALAKLEASLGKGVVNTIVGSLAAAGVSVGAKTIKNNLPSSQTQ